jgi:hypothetical protein
VGGRGERGGLVGLCWPGGDLLSRALRRSTIGAEGFDGRVRDGIGFLSLAMTTRPGKPFRSGVGPGVWCGRAMSVFVAT